MSGRELVALAERCEKATGPDRELDAAILVATSGDELRIENGGVICRTSDPDYGDGWAPAGFDIPEFTKSLDAAQLLLTRTAAWIIGSGVPELLKLEPRYLAARPWARIGNNQGRPDCTGATPALALCAAALRARAALAQASAQGDGDGSS